MLKFIYCENKSQLYKQNKYFKQKPIEVLIFFLSDCQCYSIFENCMLCMLFT